MTEAGAVHAQAVAVSVQAAVGGVHDAPTVAGVADQRIDAGAVTENRVIEAHFLKHCQPAGLQ